MVKKKAKVMTKNLYDKLLKAEKKIAFNNFSSPESKKIKNILHSLNVKVVKLKKKNLKNKLNTAKIRNFSKSLRNVKKSFKKWRLKK